MRVRRKPGESRAGNLGLGMKQRSSGGGMAAAFLLAASLGLSACAEPLTGFLAPFQPAEIDEPVDAPRKTTYVAMLKVGQAARDAGDFRSAVQFYRRAHAMLPQEPAPLISLGESLNAMGESGEAATAFRKALDIAPRDAVAMRGLGNALLGANQPELAARQFEESLNVSEDYRAYLGLGVAMNILGEFVAAEELYRQGLDLAPGNLALTNNLALSLALSQRYEEAILLMEQLLENPDVSVRHRQNLALIYGLAGRMEDARHVASLDLDEESVERNLAFYELLRGIEDPSAKAAGLGAFANGGGVSHAPEFSREDP